MKRRNFIKLSSTATALSLLPTDVFALFKSAGMDSCPNVNAKKIVLIQLSGANDGLNTVVPLNQYDKYAALRPNIKLSNTGANGVINLDTMLSPANQVGLHPSLSKFKNLYDSGLMRIIQGVGYPIQDKSHFKSTDLWLTGGDGTPANNILDSGWVGRFLENYYANFINANFPLGIQLGSSENSLGFHGEIEHGMAMNINGQDPSGFYNVINGLGGAPPSNIPDSEYGNLLKYILDNDTSSDTYAQTIQTAFNAGSNSSTYPNTSLANQLKTVAKFISGGLQTKVYLVKIGGFDTHNLQVASSTNSHLGTHANLMTQISEAINAFITDINSQNIGDDVVAVTFSEFGRKAAENGNLGTDHGEIAPMFVFGTSIAPGISGTNIDLNEAVSGNNYQIQTVQHDYRRVFSTILQDWFGTNDTTLDLTFYNNTINSGYSNAKIANMIKSQNLVPQSCYTDKLSGEQLGLDNFEVKNGVVVYLNPISETMVVQSMDTINSVSVYSIDGRIIKTYRNPLTTKEYTINAQHFAVGLYILKITTNQGVFSKKIIIRR
jgi:uncharacterized protein (DUF1501 family)